MCSSDLVFGTLRVWGHDSFLMRGLAKVRAEFSLSALIYNLVSKRQSVLTRRTAATWRMGGA